MTDGPGSLVSLQRLTTGGHDLWRKASPALYVSLGSAVGFYEETWGRNVAGGEVAPRFADLQDNTRQETDRLDM